METMEAILTRRSVREFLHQPIAEETVQKILKAGMSAPSAYNKQPWHFVVITDRSILSAIAVSLLSAQMCAQASLGLALCADLTGDDHTEFWEQDLAAATENILLAVRALDLGGVWIGIYPKKERMQKVQKLLNIPTGIMPFSLIAIGKTDQEQKSIDRYKPERVHLNTW